MYVLAIIRYRKPLDEVVKHQDAHRAHLGRLKAEGLLLAAGPLEPRFGGAVLLRLPDDGYEAALLAIRDGDPYVTAGVAQYELLSWMPVLGREDLDRI
jgi:uncharacterized protein YciI